MSRSVPLDAFTRMNMQDEILRIWKETGMTAIMVTHDVDEAVYLSDKVVVMTPPTGTHHRHAGYPAWPAREHAARRIFFTTVRKILRQLHYGGTIQEPNYYI